MKSAAVKVTVDSKKVRETLAALPMRLNESIRKKAIRKVFKQPVKDLKNEFRTMNFRGKKPHRRAIASATKLLSPKRMANQDRQSGPTWAFNMAQRAVPGQRDCSAYFTCLRTGSGTRAGAFGDSSELDDSFQEITGQRGGQTKTSPRLEATSKTRS